MAAARFSVDFQTRPDPNGIPLADGSRVAFDQNGLDRVEFLVAPNPGEGLKPLVKIRLRRRDLAPDAGVEEYSGKRRPDPHADLR